MPESMGNSGERSDFASALFDRMTCGTIAVSGARKIIAFNSAAERLTGLRGTEALGQPIAVLPAMFQAVIDDTLASGNNIIAKRIDWPGRKHQPFQVTTEIARDSDSKIHSVLIQFHDLASAQEIAANLEHLDRLANVGMLGASAAHEIRNALVAVRTFVGLLQERHKDDDLTPLVSSEMARIDAVVRQLLQGATRGKFTPAPLSIHALIHDSVGLLRREFEARSIELNVSLGAVIDSVKGDVRQLRHALLNLLLNAFEAASGAGRISVSTDNVTAAGCSHLRLIISDTGGGIRPEHLPRIFSPFFTTKKDGTGLGLAITRSIIEEHEGSIRVHSRLGEGAEFELLLPTL
jgi:two-component system sensor histidine kinase HydH